MNVKNSIKDTPLHVAEEKNDMDMLRLLVDAGADINARALFDETPMDAARREGATATEAELARLSAK